MKRAQMGRVSSSMSAIPCGTVSGTVYGLNKPPTFACRYAMFLYLRNLVMKAHYCKPYTASEYAYGNVRQG